jgi:DNA-binding winged helix-turn-helix (wHTH) protein
MLGLHSVPSIGRIMIYQFAGRTLDTARRELRLDDDLIAIEPQVFDVLTFLIEARDRVVSRDDL